MDAVKDSEKLGVVEAADPTRAGDQWAVKWGSRPDDPGQGVVPAELVKVT
ncbi:hypothetical protein HNQ08_005006 [Deinococcus humi]|uniref:Uncharacterized protein n=1 Tax=Deinococcus humi TaxID=662880 RepID=A0A7W8NHH4_9DEIO|nr:hypothetical protein [Deinococcus humi]GGO38816.1 hypothetical protein GCM10008949_46000 [Deinococcus humi]